MTEKKKIITIKEAAKLIDGLSEYRIRQMCISGQLPAFKAGNKYLIAEENLYKTVFGNKGVMPYEYIYRRKRKA